jgi:hypothetical protein
MVEGVVVAVVVEALFGVRGGERKKWGQRWW